MEPYHFCGNEDDHNKRSNESHIISLGKPHSPSELDQNDTIPFQPQACSSPNTCLKAPTILGSSNGSNNRSFYGPIRHNVPEKYHDYIPSKMMVASSVILMIWPYCKVHRICTFPPYMYNLS